MIKDMSEKELYYAIVIDKSEEEYQSSRDIRDPLLKEAVEYFEHKAQENMGIGFLNFCYVFANPDQDKVEEYLKITDFIEDYVQNYASRNGKSAEDYTLKFINYGRTQLVHVLVDDETNEKITILTKQPSVPFGKAKQELGNLMALKRVDKNVVAPIDYFTNGEQELYVTPYINQARCVGSDGHWGMYIPEPFYRFESFTPEQEAVVNTCMIAKLVSYYNPAANEGVCACKLGGGDFMLPKGWETGEPTIENTLPNMYCISAREKYSCSLEEYVNIIRDEFSRATIDENQDDLIINHRGRVAMDTEHIESGISLGLELMRNANLETVQE